MRFLRNRLASGKTHDGMSAPNCNNVILDHYSIRWTLDEAFSAHPTDNITLQRTLISEALNQAGHDQNGPAAQHGFAASVLGDIGSHHHNFPAHCVGRNWSMAGKKDENGNSIMSHRRGAVRNTTSITWTDASNAVATEQPVFTVTTREPCAPLPEG